MSNEKPPSPFGPSSVFDPATYKPRAGKTFNFQFHEGDVGHTVVFAPSGAGMSIAADYAALSLTPEEVSKIKQ